MDINKLGVEATLGYFIASSLAYGLRISFTYYNYPYLILLVVKAVLMVGMLVLLAHYFKGNFAELIMLAALVIVGLGAL